MPCPLLFSGFGNVPGLTVASWGNPTQSMSAMSVPPKAGLVAVMTLPSARSSVQSAVRPLPSDAATLGASSLPIGVAPNSTTAGPMRSIMAHITSA